MPAFISIVSGCTLTNFLLEVYIAYEKAHETHEAEFVINLNGDLMNCWVKYLIILCLSVCVLLLFTVGPIVMIVSGHRISDFDLYKLSCDYCAEYSFDSTNHT